MTVTATMTLMLLMSGGLSVYLVVRAVIDLYRHGPGGPDEG